MSASQPAEPAGETYRERYLLKKRIEDVQEEASSSGLARTLGAWDLAMLGVGAMIGAGIFTAIGVVAARTGPAIIVSYLVTALAAGLAALCYAELSTALPVSGSAYAYTYATLGEIVAWVVGWNLLLEYMVGNMAVAVAWSQYFVHNMLPFVGLEPCQAAGAAGACFPVALQGSAQMVDGGVFDLFAFLIVMGVTALLVKGVKESARVNNILVFVKLGVLLLFMAVGAFYVSPENLAEFAPNGWGYALSTAPALLFFAFIGFDAVSTAAEETKRPQRDLPRGILGSLLAVTAIYMLVSFVLVGMLAYDRLNVGDPLARAFAVAGQPSLATLVAAGAVAATTSVLLVFQLGTTRIFFNMARDGFLPLKWTRLHPRYQTPAALTVATGAAVAVPAALLPLDVLIELTNIGTLFAFTLVMGGLMAMRREQPEAHHGFRVPFYPFVPLAGMALCVYLMAALPPLTILRFFAWLGVGLMVYGFYGARRSVARAKREGRPIEVTVSEPPAK